MRKLNVSFQNCYGIKKLDYQFDFTRHKAYAIYAPNGAMKTSFALTFKDISSNSDTCDRIFPNRICKRVVTDENGAELCAENVFVICPYDESYIHTEKTSTLLVNSALRKEYEGLYIEIDKSKENFLRAVKEKSGSKKDLESEIAAIFTQNNLFYQALLQVKDEVYLDQIAPYAEIQYDIIFDDKVLGFLGTKDFKNAIEDYIKKYNDLLAASTYFKKGTFNYYNASIIAKNLSDNGFFNAKHSVNLNADERIEITSAKQLDDLVLKEKESISNDKELKKKFNEIEKLITKNVTVRDFEAYIEKHEEILPKLADIEGFKKEIWISYFKVCINEYKDLVEKYLAGEKRRIEIEDEAGRQRTQWEKVIDIFNDRFFVPFKLTAKNKIPVILGKDPLLTVDFTYEDGAEEAQVDRRELLTVLSTGEKKALYILNVIFEVEARKKLSQETLFIVDDLADSFDYKNKYAIIQYLKDIDDENFFSQIILTHNFDLYRTINSRFVNYAHCLMSVKSNLGVSFEPALGIKNIFVNDWKENFFLDSKKKIASIPFIRNIIEYTKGENDPDYVKLTSLLHWKPDSVEITRDVLDGIFNNVFSTMGRSDGENKKIFDLLVEEADHCLNEGEGINFENKIVLSIAIRIIAEQFMISKINDPVFVEAIESNQTPALFGKYKQIFPDENQQISVIQRVILMTPENIHLNSFMYEPILDMSDEHLRALYSDVKQLNNP